MEGSKDMFGFLKKKEEKVTDNSLYAVANGTLVPIVEVNDPVFSQKMMGDGYAVVPTDGNIYAPVAAEVVSVFQTKHAVGFKMASGIEVLLHMGVDTVELKGAPFDIQVSEGDKVTPGTLIAKVDIDAIKAAGKAIDMIVVITNMDAVADFSLDTTTQVAANDKVGSVTAK